MSIFKGFGEVEDDDPRTNPVGFKEEMDAADLPDDAPGEAVSKPAQKPEPEPARAAVNVAPVGDEKPAQPIEDNRNTPEMNAPSEPANQPAQDPAQNATQEAVQVSAKPKVDEQPAAEQTPEKTAGATLVPQVNPGYLNLPDGPPINETFEQRHLSEVDSGEVVNTVTPIADEAAFVKEAEEHLAISQGQGNDDIPDWIKVPKVWPNFMKFPPKRDLDAIRRAEEMGALTDEAKADFNANFAELSELMQARARQLDAWIIDENKNILSEERKRMFLFQPHMKKQLKELNKARGKADKNNAKFAKKGKGEYIPDDPFKDIKWAILLDPHASPDDPRFAKVARWGHNCAQTVDGGKLISTDKGMHVASWNKGTEMAGELAVREAIQRGWTSINITGNEAFIKGAREAALAAGLGAKLTTVDGYIGRSRPEYIMPKPPKLAGFRTDQEKALDAHKALMSDDGKAGSAKPDAEQKPQRELARPGAGKAAEKAPENSADARGAAHQADPEDQIDVAEPFEDDPADEEAMRKLQAREAAEQATPELA